LDNCNRKFYINNKLEQNQISITVNLEWKYLFVTMRKLFRVCVYPKCCWWWCAL